MKDTELSILEGIAARAERTEMKLDLMFGLLSNQTLATQAMEAANIVHNKANGELTDIDKEYIEKLQEVYNSHTKNLGDSMDYYIKLYGEASNKEVVELMTEWEKANPDAKNEAPAREAYEKEQNSKEPAPVAKVNVSGSRKSSKED